jgi:DNA-binding transcriptional ArsR family regulator
MTGNAPSPIDATIAALADPTRRFVVDTLRSGARPAGEIARLAGMSRPAMSRHLRVLRMSGLVEEESPEQDSRIRLYSLRREPFSALEAWLEQVQSFWNDQLASFKSHAEKHGQGSGR